MATRTPHGLSLFSGTKQRIELNLIEGTLARVQNLTTIQYITTEQYCCLLVHMERVSLWLFAEVWIHVDSSSFVRDQEMWEHWTTGQTSNWSTELDILGANMTNTTRRLDNDTMLEATHYGSSR